MLCTLFADACFDDNQILLGANVSFLATAEGSSATMPCPDGWSGNVTRACAAGRDWGAPDFDECTGLV